MHKVYISLTYNYFYCSWLSVDKEVGFYKTPQTESIYSFGNHVHLDWVQTGYKTTKFLPKKCFPLQPCCNFIFLGCAFYVWFMVILQRHDAMTFSGGKYMNTYCGKRPEIAACVSFSLYEGVGRKQCTTGVVEVKASFVLCGVTLKCHVFGNVSFAVWNISCPTMF